MVIDCTLWPNRILASAMCRAQSYIPTQVFVSLQGALTIDEAVSLGQAVAGGNPGTCVLVLLPQYHSSTSQINVIKNRRLLEDKVVSCFGIVVVTLHVCQCFHQTFVSVKSRVANMFHTMSLQKGNFEYNYGMP